MPTLKVDGEELTVGKGTTIIQAAQELGIFIPHYCWHPGLSIAGNCRMCLVEVEPETSNCLPHSVSGRHGGAYAI